MKALAGPNKFHPLNTAETVNFDKEDSIEADGLHIDIVPVWKWLLREQLITSR